MAELAEETTSNSPQTEAAEQIMEFEASPRRYINLLMLHWELGSSNFNFLFNLLSPLSYLSLKIRGRGSQ